MESTIDVEIDEPDNSNDTETLIENTARRMSDQEIETLPNVSVTFEEVGRPIRAVNIPLSKLLNYFC